MSAATACAHLAIKVSPRAARTELAGWPSDSSLHLRLAALPVNGAAKSAAIALLAKRLRIGGRRISFVRGAASSTKLVQIDGMTLADVRACLAH